MHPKRGVYITLVLALFLITFSAQLLPVFAQADPDFVGIGTSNTNYTFLQNTLRPSMYLRTILNILLGGAGVASFVLLIWGGIDWITAGGDKEGVEKARRKLVAAITGIIIVFSAFTILLIMRTWFNVNLIQLDLGSLGSHSGAAGSYGGTGGTGGGGTDPALIGNDACGGCIDGGCGVTGQWYIGPGVAPNCYQCTATGWQFSATATCAPNYCGTCP